MSNSLRLENVPVHRTVKRARYEKYIDEVRNMLDGKTPEDQLKMAAANERFMKGIQDPTERPRLPGSGSEKAVTPASVHQDALLTTVSVMYANDAYIGEQLMPVVSVPNRSDKFSTYPKRERLAFPDDKIGSDGKPNEIDSSRSTDNYSVQDYALVGHRDLEAIAKQQGALNEMIDVVEEVADGLLFKREARILTIVTTSGNYAGNTTTAGTNWNDSTGGSLIADLLAARAAIWSGHGAVRRVGFCPITVWNSGIANNPTLLSKFNYVKEGLPATQQVAAYFRLDDILITEARQDTANIGQTASYGRMVTADVFGIVTVAQRPSPRSAHWGSTFRTSDTPYTSQWIDPSIGVRGAVKNKSAVSEDHKVVAGDTGYYLTSLLT